MQTQVAEYKQLKDTLNRIPSFRNPDPAEQRNVTFPRGTPQGYNIREKPTGELREVRGVPWGSLIGGMPCGKMLSVQPTLPSMQIPRSSYTSASLVQYV